MIQHFDIYTLLLIVSFLTYIFYRDDKTKAAKTQYEFISQRQFLNYTMPAHLHPRAYRGTAAGLRVHLPLALG